MGMLRKQLLLLLVCVGAVTRASAADDANRPLKLLVPLRVGFTEFVAWERAPPDNRLSFSGFSVDVFRRCVDKLPYPLSYEFVQFGDGVINPSYSAMVQKLVSKEADGIVADITITEDRMRLVDFTQPYIQSSLVMVVPFHHAAAGQFWGIFQPFAAKLWGVIAGAFVFTGLIIFYTEYEGEFLVMPTRQVRDTIILRDDRWITRMGNAFWFTSMTLFFCQRRDQDISKPGGVVTFVWLIVVLIVTSAYRASLTSMLLAQQQSPTIDSYEDLLRSSLPVGYQEGSFMDSYIDKSLLLRPSRVVNLTNEKDFVDAFKLGPEKGGVAAILDESPYVQSFLNSECKYTSSGNEIAYFGGFGFAFQKNSNVTDDISLAIISLSKNRELQNLKDSYLGSRRCVKTKAGTLISLDNFVGLFIIMGAVYNLCVLLRLLGLVTRWW